MLERRVGLAEEHRKLHRADAEVLENRIGLDRAYVVWVPERFDLLKPLLILALSRPVNERCEPLLEVRTRMTRVISGSRSGRALRCAGQSVDSYRAHEYVLRSEPLQRARGR